MDSKQKAVPHKLRVAKPKKDPKAAKSPVEKNEPSKKDLASRPKSRDEAGAHDKHAASTERGGLRNESPDGAERSSSSSDSEDEDVKSAASEATAVDERRKSVVKGKTPKQKLYSARIKIMALRKFVELIEGLDPKLRYKNRSKARDHDARVLDYRDAVDGSTDLMKSWGEYRRMSFGLNPGGTMYGAKNPVCWDDLGYDVPFLEVGPDVIMQAIRDQVEETIGRRLPYDWSFPQRPMPEHADADAQPDLLEDAAYARLRPGPEENQGSEADSTEMQRRSVFDPKALNKKLIEQFTYHHEISDDEEDPDKLELSSVPQMFGRDKLETYLA